MSEIQSSQAGKPFRQGQAGQLIIGEIQHGYIGHILNRKIARRLVDGLADRDFNIWINDVYALWLCDSGQKQRNGK